MPFGGALIAGAIAAPIIGGIMGAEASRGDREAANRAAAEAYKEIAKLQAPPDLAKRIIIEKLKQVGVYKPEMEQAIEAGASKMVNIQENEQARQAKMLALSKVKEKAMGGGLSAEDRLGINTVRNQIAADLQGQQGAIRQNFASRGLSGSGQELAMQLSAQQSAGQEASMQADRLAAMRQQGSLAALSELGRLGTGISSQDFEMDSAKASAADRFRLFDVQNSMSTNRANVAAANQARLYNLGEQQRIDDYNKQAENAERYRQNEGKRTYWRDQLDLASMKSNAKLGQAQQYQNQASATAGMYQGIGSGIGAGAAAGLDYVKKPTAQSNQTVSMPEKSALDNNYWNKNPYE